MNSCGTPGLNIWDAVSPLMVPEESGMRRTLPHAFLQKTYRDHEIACILRIHATAVSHVVLFWRLLFCHLCPFTVVSLRLHPRHPPKPPTYLQ